MLEFYKQRETNLGNKFAIAILSFCTLLVFTFQACDKQVTTFSNGYGYSGAQPIPVESEELYEPAETSSLLAEQNFIRFQAPNSCNGTNGETPSHSGLLFFENNSYQYQANLCSSAQAVETENIGITSYNKELAIVGSQAFEVQVTSSNEVPEEAPSTLLCRYQFNDNEGIDIVIRQNESEQAVTSPTQEFSFLNSIPSGVTFRRPNETESVASYVDSNGVIQFAAPGAPRFGHHPLTGEALGLLMEDSARNLIQTNTFPYGFTVENGSQQSEVALNPDGTTATDKFIESASDGAQGMRLVDLPAVATPGTWNDNTLYSMSLFVKAQERSLMRFSTKAKDGSPEVHTWFDVQSGLVRMSQHAHKGIEPFKNGWYRIWVQFDIKSGAGLPEMAFYLATSDGEISYQGDGTSGVHIWGLQIEERYFPTNYIPAGKLRRADRVELNNPDQLDTQEGAYLFNISHKYSSSSDHDTLFSIGERAVDTTRFEINEGNLEFSKNTSGTPEERISHIPLNKSPLRLALSWSGAEGHLAVDGQTQFYSGAQLPTSYVTVAFGGPLWQDNALNGHLKSIQYYNKALAQEELAHITSGNSSPFIVAKGLMGEVITGKKQEDGTYLKTLSQTLPLVKGRSLGEPSYLSESFAFQLFLTEDTLSGRFHGLFNEEEVDITLQCHN